MAYEDKIIQCIDCGKEFTFNAEEQELFAQRGYERTTIAAIASEAQVSRAAVFWHFGDKANLFQESCRELLVPFVACWNSCVIASTMF